MRMSQGNLHRLDIFRNVGETVYQYDRRNRNRPHTLIFRVTPRQQLELKCREFLCGRTLQDYMLQSAMTQQVIVAGDRALLERVINSWMSSSHSLRSGAREEMWISRFWRSSGRFMK